MARHEAAPRRSSASPGDVPKMPYGDTCTWSVSASASCASASRSCAFEMTALSSHGTSGQGRMSKTPARNASSEVSGRCGSTTPMSTARGRSVRMLRAMRRASPPRVQSSRHNVAGCSRSSPSACATPVAHRSCKPSPPSVDSTPGRSEHGPPIQTTLEPNGEGRIERAVEVEFESIACFLSHAVTSGLRGHGAERAVAGIDQQLARAVGRIHNPAIGLSRALGVERHFGERPVLPGFPLVQPAIAGRVFLDSARAGLVRRSRTGSPCRQTAWTALP